MATLLAHRGESGTCPQTGNAGTATRWIWIRRALIFALIVFAVFVRADGLDDPNYWYDEAITSLRVAGHTERQVAAFAESHPKFPIGELKQFVQVDGQTRLGDTVGSLSSEAPQHTPLYYVSARLWALGFGSSVAVGRGLAVLMSLLALAGMYWLCLELFVKTGAFESTLVCWLGVLTMALSPYQVAIAREHREYSMWTLTTTLACAAFLRAWRKNTAASWMLYGTAMSVSLYTHLLSALTLAALGIFLLFEVRFRFTRAVWSFAAASTVAVVSCAPWIGLLLTSRNKVGKSMGWIQSPTPGGFHLHASLGPVVQLVSVSIGEAENVVKELLGYQMPNVILWLAPILLLFALWRLAPGPRQMCAGFTTLLIVSASGALSVFDLLSGSSSSVALRYGVPSNLGWLLALTLLLAVAVTNPGRWKWLAWGSAGIYLFFGVASAVMTHDAEHTFAKAWEPGDEVVDFLNANGQVTVSSDGFVGAILTLGHEVRDDLSLSWRARCYSCPLSVEPPVDIPFPGGATAQTVFYRSWVNVPVATLQPLIGRLLQDQLGDPRFHTAVVKLRNPQVSLFLLTPR